MCASFLPYDSAPREGFVAVEKGDPSAALRTWLYFREIGEGPPIIILHGGPDFDHNYLLPDMDRLSDSFRLVYYDQRGRGKSAANVLPEEVGIESETADLDRVREYFGLESAAVLGHSWGGLLAMEYAIRHPERVSHLILMSSAPVSHDDYMLLRRELSRKRMAGDVEKMKVIASTAEYQEGGLEADAAYYRIHFRPTLRQPEQLEKVVKSLRLNFTPDGIRKARAIEDRLYDETWALSDYNLLPRLEGLDIPTLVIHGEYDLIPAECAEHIAQAIPGARLVLMEDCGHFSYLECPEQLRQALADFFDAAYESLEGDN